MLSEIYNLDKSSGSEVPSSVIVTVLRKAVLRRVCFCSIMSGIIVHTITFQAESAAQFVKGKRLDLAAKETQEAEIISAFLPPMLSEAEIDKVLKEVALTCPQDGNPKKVLGLVFKSFYSKVDKANVDPDLVKSRAKTLLNV